MKSTDFRKVMETFDLIFKHSCVDDAFVIIKKEMIEEMDCKLFKLIQQIDAVEASTDDKLK